MTWLVAFLLRSALLTMRPTWSHPLPARPRGLSLAREKGSLLTWDETHWLYLLSRDGQRQAQRNFGPALAAACLSDDGSACIAVSTVGDLWWLAPDLTTRWQLALPAAALVVAVDPLGHYVALALAPADEGGSLHVYDQGAKAVMTVGCPRPVHHLAFVPQEPLLVASADYGFVGAFDLAGRCVWRDGLVAHVGGLALTGDGNPLVLACFSEGLQRYGADGRRLERLSLEESCRLVALSFSGQQVLVAGLSKRLLLLDPAGKTLATHALEQSAIALALGPLGDYCVIALADGQVVRGEW
jgi:hypothetical protein